MLLIADPPTRIVPAPFPLLPPLSLQPDSSPVLSPETPSLCFLLSLQKPASLPSSFHSSPSSDPLIIFISLSSPPSDLQIQYAHHCPHLLQTLLIILNVYFVLLWCLLAACFLNFSLTSTSSPKDAGSRAAGAMAVPGAAWELGPAQAAAGPAGRKCLDPVAGPKAGFGRGLLSGLCLQPSQPSAHLRPGHRALLAGLHLLIIS